AAQRRHLPELARVRECRCLEAVAGREHAVARSRRTAALHVAEHGDAGLEAGALLDLAAEQLPDAAVCERHVSELVDLAGVFEPWELAALADHDDREVLAPRVPTADAVGDFLEVDRLLGDEDHVRAAGDAARDRDPAGVPAHDLD